jgi:hypothetical protein
MGGQQSVSLDTSVAWSVSSPDGTTRNYSAFETKPKCAVLVSSAPNFTGTTRILVLGDYTASVLSQIGLTTIGSVQCGPCCTVDATGASGTIHANGGQSITNIGGAGLNMTSIIITPNPCSADYTEHFMDGSSSSWWIMIFLLLLIVAGLGGFTYWYNHVRGRTAPPLVSGDGAKQ